jgi:hypothetical protein
MCNQLQDAIEIMHNMQRDIRSKLEKTTRNTDCVADWDPACIFHCIHAPKMLYINLRFTEELRHTCIYKIYKDKLACNLSYYLVSDLGIGHLV